MIETKDRAAPSGEDGYTRLVNAIVIRAAQDYRQALRALKRNPRNNTAQDNIREIEHFFRSGWYQELTDIDGEYLIEMLQKEELR